MSWMFRWSLELTGGSIILFNYQPYERQQRFIGMYRSGLNSFRTVRYMYGLYGDFKEIANMNQDGEIYQQKKE